MATALYVDLDGTDRSSLALSATVVLKTVNQGHSTFVAVMDNNDQSLNGLYDSQDGVYIKMGGADIIKGYMDDVAHSVTHTPSTWYHLLRVTGRDYSQDLSNLFLSKVWASAKKADEILDEALAYVNSEITYAAPATASTIGGYDCHQQYLMDLFKIVLDRANMEAYVDTAKALQAFNIGANSSGLTLTYSDLVGSIEYTEKAGLGIRNQILGLGELQASSPADEVTETAGHLANWTCSGTKSLSNTDPHEGSWAIRGEAVTGAPPVAVALDHELPYALDETAGVFHFWLWAWAYTNPNNFAVDSAYLRLREDSNNYFQYNFTPADIGPVVGQEYNLAIGRDHEASFTRTGYPDWASINNMYFYARTNTEDAVYMEVDGIGSHNMNFGGYASDATSRSAYRKRMELVQDTMLSNHDKTLDLADSILEKKKDPLEHITLTIKGDSSISGGAYKLWPGYKVTLNYPKIGMTNEVWRVETAELKCFPYQDLSGHGHDFTAKLSCVPQATKIDHLELATVAKARSLVPFLSREAFKRRSQRKWLP